MDVTITRGGIGNIRILPFTLHITGLADVDQDIDIPLQVAGRWQICGCSIIRLWAMRKRWVYRLTIWEEKSKARSISAFLCWKKALAMKDLAIHAEANATSIATTKLVPGIAVGTGNLALTLDTSGFGLKGQANLNKIPFQIVWQENSAPKSNAPLRHMTVTGA